MEWYNLASKQRLVWMGTLYISDPLSLLVFSMCQRPGKAGSHHLSLSIAVDILRYAGCGPASPVDKARPQTNWHIICIIFYQCIYGCIPVEYCNLCIFIVMSMYSYCMIMYLHRANWHSLATLTEVFPCFFLSCNANARV
jgi:hypothetical protein